MYAASLLRSPHSSGFGCLQDTDECSTRNLDNDRLLGMCTVAEAQTASQNWWVLSHTYMQDDRHRIIQLSNNDVPPATGWFPYHGSGWGYLHREIQTAQGNPCDLFCGDLAVLNFRARRLTRKVANSLQRLSCNGWNLEVCGANSSDCSFSLQD